MAFTRIQEYISTDDGTAGQLLIPQLILPTIIEEVDKNVIPRELARTVYGPEAAKGPTFYIDLETPNTMKVREVGEGSEIPMDAMEFEATSVTPVKYGVAIRITREMMEDSQFELLQRNVRKAGVRFAENESKLVFYELDGANATTSGGAAITIANITESMYDLDSNDYKPTDILVGPEVLQDLRNIDTFAEADKWGGKAAAATGTVSVIYGMTVHLFSMNVSPTTTYSKYAYVLDRNEAYCLCIKRDITMENFALPTYDTQGAVLTQRIAAKLLRSKAVSKITTS